MTNINSLGAALALSAFLATPASAWQAISEPAAAAASDPTFSVYSNYGSGMPIWPRRCRPATRRDRTCRYGRIAETTPTASSTTELVLRNHQRSRLRSEASPGMADSADGRVLALFSSCWASGWVEERSWASSQINRIHSRTGTKGSKLGSDATLVQLTHSAPISPACSKSSFPRPYI